MNNNTNTTVFANTIDGVRQFLSTIPQETEKLRFILGLVKVENAPKLADSIVVNCIDTENYERDQSRLLEVGINAFESGSLRQHSSNPGPNGEKMLKEIYYYHFRIKENANYINKKFCPGNPDANRFGNTRFTTIDEAKNMLATSFSWEITAGEPQGGICPSVLIGHDIAMDTNGLARTIGFDPISSGTVVAMLDTQQMAREVGIYNPAGRNNKIGLKTLAAHFDIPYRDAHIAGNDAAYTIIAAI